MACDSFTRYRLLPNTMPTEYRISGHDIGEGAQKRTPKAAVHICEVCGFEGAPFGVLRGDTTLSYCGYVGGLPQCVGKGKQAAPVLAAPAAPW